MEWRPLLDLLFPAQCACCNALGSGLCESCSPKGENIRIRLPGLAVTALGPYEDSLRSAVLALKDGRRDVALFDDVCTTGSTLRDCAAALREAGALVEHAVVIAVAKSGDPWREPIPN
jgi:predicted amidophosphoribosyltransferase